MRKLLLIIGACGIVAGFFYGTLFFLDYFYPRTPDAIRANNAQAIMAALESYREAKGLYPVLPVPDSLVTELAKPLVGGGFISTIPPDPAGQQTARYASFDGKGYGLLLGFQRTGTCLIEVRISNSGFWGQPPRCPL